MNRNKLAALLVGLALALFAVGCGGNANSGNANTGNGNAAHSNMNANK
jgi:hypothetical protein